MEHARAPHRLCSMRIVCNKMISAKVHCAVRPAKRDAIVSIFTWRDVLPRLIACILDFSLSSRAPRRLLLHRSLIVSCKNVHQPTSSISRSSTRISHSHQIARRRKNFLLFFSQREYAMRCFHGERRCSFALCWPFGILLYHNFVNMEWCGCGGTCSARTTN